jgi:hypothetical protein
MITLIPIEPLNEQHGALIVAAFNRFFIDEGGQPNGDGTGNGSYGDGNGTGNGTGNGGDGYGDGWGYGSKIPDEWRVE